MRNIYLLILIMFFGACNNDATVEEPAGDTTMTEEVADMPAAPLPWVSDYDTVKNEFYLRQQREVDTATVSAETLIADLNAAWENVRLKFVKISRDTIYVAIPDSEVLGQQMGSAGAQAYMASTTYNLTELPGVNYVNYDMKSGDHVSPGTFSRKSFENYR